MSIILIVLSVYNCHKPIEPITTLNEEFDSIHRFLSESLESELEHFDGWKYGIIIKFNQSIVCFLCFYLTHSRTLNFSAHLQLFLPYLI